MFHVIFHTAVEHCYVNVVHNQHLSILNLENKFRVMENWAVFKLYYSLFCVILSEGQGQIYLFTHVGHSMYNCFSLYFWLSFLEMYLLPGSQYMIHPIIHSGRLSCAVTARWCCLKDQCETSKRTDINPFNFHGSVFPFLLTIKSRATSTSQM